MTSRGARFTEAEREAMRSALDLARQGTGRVSPNPLVGALLADAGGKRIAAGHHDRFGGPHAEQGMLDSLRGRAIPRDAVLHLTLEPCVHQGKTPPCIRGLLASPIRRFVIATADADPRTRGRGIRALRADGREVRVGLLREEARAMNEPYFLAQDQGRARILLKIASTLDGKQADFEGRSRWITGPAAREEVARLRGRCDAVVVGGGTVRADDPRLRSRAGDPAPSRIVVSSRLGFDPQVQLARIWREEVGGLPDEPTERHGNWIAMRSAGGRVRWIRRPRLIAAAVDPAPRRSAMFERAGWEIWRLPAASSGVDLKAVARRACREGLIDLMVEPGPRMASAFLRSGPVDRILLFVAPTILGGDLGWTRALPPIPLARILRGSIVPSPRMLGGDVIVEVASIAAARHGVRGGGIARPRRPPVR